MLRLLKFEIKKIIRNKKGLALFGFMVLLIIIFIFSGVQEVKVYEHGKLDAVKDKITELEKQKEDKELFRLNAFYFNKKEAALKEKANAIFQYKWRDELNFDVQLQQIEIDHLKEQGSDDEESLKQFNDSIKNDKWYLDNNIQPVSTDISIIGNFFIINFFKKFFPMLVVILLLLSVSDILSDEIDTGTYKILLLQPIKRGKIVLTKLFASIIYNLFFVAISVIPAYFITCSINTFFTGWGSSIYPVTINKNCLPMLFSQGLPMPGKTTVSTELLLIIGVVVTAIIMVTCIAVFISTLTSSSFQSIIASLGVFFVLFVANNTLPANLKVYNPFSYFDPVSLVQGVNGSILNLTLCYEVTPILCIVLVFIGIFVYSKRDLQD